MRKKVHQIEEKCEVLDKLQKLSKENGKDDTKLRNFAAKLNRLDAAVQPQQNTRSLDSAVQTPNCQGCGGCQEGQARSEESQDA